MTLPDILHRDDHFLVVNKPAGLPTTSPDGRNCLAWTVANELDRGAPHAHPSSRLDRDVTGVVFFARTDRGIQHLLAARAANAYLRSYRALVSPAPSTSEGRWTWPIAVAPRDRRLRVALEEGQRGERMQEASTRFSLLATRGHAAWLAVAPETGRTHQIRVHAARAGAPIVGDVDYGGARRLVLADGRVLAAPRVMLHCREVSVPRIGSSGGGTPLVVRAPFPEDLVLLWQKLGGTREELDEGTPP